MPEKKTSYDTLGFWGRLKSIPERADNIAEEVFRSGRYDTSSARDSSAKNSFRHALGTGMITRELGGGYLAGTAAKLLGYGWEAMGIPQMTSADHRRDTLHDLNANAIGAATAVRSNSQEDLVRRLERLAKSAPVAEPPGLFESSPGHLTRTVR